MEGGRNLRLLQPFNDWRIDMVDGFIGLIKNKKVHPFVEDRMVWTKAKDGLFSVKSLLDVLEGATVQVQSLPRKLIWNPCVPTKVSLFAWEV